MWFNFCWLQEKMTGIRLLIIFGTIVTLLETTNLTNACNEALCGSVVTKCILKDTCNCDLSTCSCCKECYVCLGDLFTTCCSCFGKWKNYSDTIRNIKTKNSRLKRKLFFN